MTNPTLDKTWVHIGLIIDGSGSMAEMDGKELCKLLKTNFKTSHIPIVMLTALADIDDKIQGLETGADAYVEKPFNVSILKATINNLIKSRENVNRLLDDKKVKKQLTPDESFLSDVINVIKENLTDKEVFKNFDNEIRSVVSDLSTKNILH